MEGAEGEIRIARTGLIAFGEHFSSETICSLFSNSECVEHVSFGSKDNTDETTESHMVVACASGRVYTFGYNKNHNWMTKDAINQPTLVAALKKVKIVQVACGSGSTYFLTDVGELYSCGESNYGQLGLGGSSYSATPVRVQDLPKIKNVAAGAEHTVVLTQDGDVYVCGCNEYGQLGLGHRTPMNVFTLVTALPGKVTDIACGSNHSVLLTECNVVVLAGRNNFNQLGMIGDDSQNFQPVSLPDEIISIACGSNHTVAHTSSNRVWAWGANDSCQLGNGQYGESDLASQVLGLEGHTIISIFAGYSHTAFVTDQGDILVCGRGESGELLRKKTTVTVPTLLSKSPGLRVKQIVFGKNFSLLVATSKIPKTTLHKCGISCPMNVQVISLVTDMRKVILKCLECPVCLNPMRDPIHMCVNGHSVCGPCYSQLTTLECPLCRQEFSEVRNIALQYLAAEIQMPCTECLLCMPIADLERHAIDCPNRHYSCPLGETCGFRGRPEALLAHALSNHPQQTLQELPHTFTHSLLETEVFTELMVEHKQLFILHRTSTTDEVRFTVGHIGPPDDANKYKFILEFNADSDDYSVTIRNVRSYVENDENLFKTQPCALIKKDQFTNYLKNDNVRCKIHILCTNN